AGTLNLIEHERNPDRNPIKFYVGFLRGLLRGDMGRSVVFNRPVGVLIRERTAVTLVGVIEGLGASWLLALSLGLVAALSRQMFLRALSLGLSTLLLCLPSAVLATLWVLLRLPAPFAVAAVVFPRVLPHAYEQFRAALASPHIAMARAQGLSPL